MEDTYSCTQLNMVFPNRAPVVHSIKCSHFIHAHRGHFQNPGNLIHDTETREAMLALSQVQ